MVFPRLYLLFPEANDPFYEVTPGQEVIVGRAGVCDLDLTHYFDSGLNVISREHFKIFYTRPAGFMIVDLSHNGTQVNDDFLTRGRPRILRSGDIIKLAKSERLRLAVKIEQDPGITDSIDDPEQLFETVSEVRPGLYFDEPSARFVLDGRPVPHQHLTKVESELLRYLWLNAGRPCTFEAIAARVWNDPGGGPGSVNNTISKVVGSLRKKLNRLSPGAGEYIQNIRGQGYELLTGP